MLDDALRADEKLQGGALRIAPTSDPTTAVNLEYLSLALRVRLLDGREPLFSLDPKAGDFLAPSTDPHQDKWQVKHFAPNWLANTSVGDVLFQADYHLKELSMGEHPQPVLGMKSCVELSKMKGATPVENWRAREWFVVRGAEVRVSNGNTLVPRVMMAVQARQQVYTSEGGLVDDVITRKDHPMVKYAEAFTHNFDLIAERRSCFYYLRELAKASILAKFLVDSQIGVEDLWLNLAQSSPSPCCLEIPQLWNERCYADVRVKDGQLMDTAQSLGKHGIYGGVQFGLEKFTLAAPRQIAGMAPPPLGGLAVGAPLPPVGAMRGARQGARAVAVAGAAGAEEVTSAATTATMSNVYDGVADLYPVIRHLPGGSFRLGAAGGAAPRGVDLNLNQFDLTALPEAKSEAPKASWSSKEQPRQYTALGTSFWGRLDGTFQEEALEAEDRDLLKTLFNPHLSDRRVEGDRFVPPDGSYAYVSDLRRLVEEEEEVRQQRMEHFCSKAFVASAPGPLFPHSWTTPGGHVQYGASAPGGKPELLHALPAYRAQHLVEHILGQMAPIFEKRSEDGSSFRIYQVDSLEVRTFQEQSSKEVIAAVFSLRASCAVPAPLAASSHVGDGEKVAKVAVYVERASDRESALPLATAPKPHPTLLRLDLQKRAALPEGAAQVPHRFYAVVETEKGNMIVTEKTKDGAALWVENPQGMEVRNSLARVLRCASCSETKGLNLTIRAFKDLRARAAARGKAPQLGDNGKGYAYGIYREAISAGAESCAAAVPSWWPESSEEAA
jgi:hypothetical protein